MHLRKRVKLCPQTNIKNSRDDTAILQDFGIETKFVKGEMLKTHGSNKKLKKFYISAFIVDLYVNHKTIVHNLDWKIYGNPFIGIFKATIPTNFNLFNLI